MFRSGSFFFRVLAVVLTVVALIIGGLFIYNAGQDQGYTLGLVASSEGAQLPAPVAPIYPGGAPYWGLPFGFFPFMPFLSLFCLGGVFLLFFFAIGAIFRPMAWRHHTAGHYPGQWHGWKGGPPPWDTPSKSKEQPAATETEGQPQSPTL